MIAAISSYPLGWKIYALALLVIGILASWWFVLRYSSKYRWWRDEFAGHIVAFSGVVAAFLTFYLVAALFPTWSWLPVIRLVLFTLLVTVVVWRVALFERLGRDQDVEVTARASPLTHSEER